MKRKKDILKTSIEGLKGGYHKDMSELKKSVTGESRGVTRLTVEVPTDLYYQVKAKASLERLTLKDLVLTYLKAYISK